MPNAKTHDTIAIIAAIPLVPLAYFGLRTLGESPELAAGGAAWVVVAHLVGSFWLSPDLDIDGSIDDRWGPFFWLWRPYMWAVPHRHRVLSHSGFSALLRLLYLYVVISGLLIGGQLLADLLGFIADRSFEQVFREWVVVTIGAHQRETWLIAAGVVFSDALHSTTDFLVTKGRRFLAFFGIRITINYRNHDRRRRRRQAWFRW